MPSTATEDGSEGEAKDPQRPRIAILGVGLIGGSIGMAARSRAGAHVTGYDTDPRVLDRALQLGAIDRKAPDIPAALAGAAVAFIAAPVGALVQTVSDALTAADGDCVISDVGSTKRMLAQAVSDERFVGGHPLAGSQTAGVSHSSGDLFDGARWYLTPSSGTSGVLYERLHRLLVSFGARPMAIEPDTHDRLMACVSHLPHVLANLLVSQAAGLLDADGQLPAVGPSFRDATRVAGANSAVWTDIYLSNADALIAGIDEFSKRLAEVRGALAQSDRSALWDWNDRARSEHEALLEAGLLGGSVHELRVSVPNRPGVIAEIALALGRAGVNIVDMALSPSPDNSQGVVALWLHGDEQAARARELIGALNFPLSGP
ncbi:MAG TPA: prephenate dehydrogenase/arogenate dehydrogenase family protein [Solirubrobacteraceae bacterium]